MPIFLRLFRRLAKLRQRHFRYWKVVFFLVFLMAAGSLLIIFFERNANEQFSGWVDGLWWCLVTITTVGYGDKYPVTAGGRAAAFVVMLGGIGSFGYLAGIFIEELLRRERGRLRVRWKNHYVICGYSFKAKNVAEELVADQPGVNIVLLAACEENPLPDFPEVKFIQGDITDENSLQKANVARAGNVIILAEDNIPEQSADARSVLATLTIRHMNPDCWISAEALHPKNEQHLRRAGANEVVCTGEISSRLLVQSNVRQYAVEFLRELLTSKKGNEIYEAELLPELCGKAFQEALREIYQRKGILLGVARKEELLINPVPGLRLQEGDILIYLAEERIF